MRCRAVGWGPGFYLFQLDGWAQHPQKMRQILKIQKLQHSNNVYDKHLRKIDFLITLEQWP
jgi:hypothetical protein